LARVFLRCVDLDQVSLVVARDRMDVGLLKERSRPTRSWPTIDQVTHAEEAVSEAIEADCLHALEHLVESAVHIADHEVTA
jgi:hypothetical protein